MFYSEIFDWVKFRRSVDSKFSNICYDLKTYFQAHFQTQVTDEYIYTLCYPTLENMIFEKAIEANRNNHSISADSHAKDTSHRRLTNFRLSPSKLTKRHLSEQAPILGLGKQPSIIKALELDMLGGEVQFFHRHKTFSEAAVQRLGIKPLSIDFRPSTGPRNNKRALGELISNHFEFEISDDCPLVETLSVFDQFIDLRNHDLPNFIMTNNHGLYYPRISMLYLLAWMKLRGKRILINQTGFMHSKLLHSVQVNYENTVADHYLAWGPEHPATPGAIHHGCYYRSRETTSSNTEKDPRPLVILPQIPVKYLSVSCFWAVPYGKYSPFIDWLETQIQKLDQRWPDAVFRCKLPDLERYRKIFAACRPEALERLIGGDINKAGGDYRHHHTILTMYYSTSIPESFEKCDVSLCLMPKSMMRLHGSIWEDFFALDGAVAEDADDLDFSGAGNAALGDYLERFATKVSPSQAIEQLRDLLSAPN